MLLPGRRATASGYGDGMSDPPRLEVGATLEDEVRSFNDARTGARIHQLTQHASVNHSFFFLNSSFRPGAGGQVAFVTHRAGAPQLCLHDSGTTTCVSAATGMQPFSPAFSGDGSSLFYTNRQGEVRQIDLHSFEDVCLAVLDETSLGECGPSPDGRFLITSCRRGKTHALLLVDIESREGRIIFERPQKILHAQFHGSNPDIIEYAGDPLPRLWIVRRDGSQNQCLYENAKHEFIVHESFLGAGDDLIFAVWPRKLARMNIHDRTMQTIADVNAWHMASSRDGRLIVSDTNHPDRGLLLIDPQTGATRVLCHPDSSNSGSQWHEDFAAGPEVWTAIRGDDGRSLSWMEMKIDSVYGPQWTHPHPAFDETAQRVVYTSDCSGQPQVYVVEVEAGGAGNA